MVLQLFLSGRHSHKAPPDLDMDIVKAGVFVFKRCRSSDVSFVSETSVKLSVGLLWAVRLLFIQTEPPPPGTACQRRGECSTTRLAPEIPYYLVKSCGGGEASFDSQVNLHLYSNQPVLSSPFYLLWAEHLQPKRPPSTIFYCLI